MTQLSTSSLAQVAQRGVAIPGYDRQSLTPGVVHIGLGAFHRAHQAMVFDTLLAKGIPHWGVLGVAMRSTLLADALKAQDGLYAVQIASVQGTHWQIPGAMLDTCVLAREARPVVQAIAAPTTRWITLTVTEKGYTPELAQLLVRGLESRQQNGLPGLTIASCDNLSHNGKRLQAACVSAAQSISTELADWVAQACVFPNSMVDRIVPAATPERLQAAQHALGVEDAAALGTEGFWEWVIEDRFVDPSDGPALASAGVTVVRDVAPFEEAKLRMLNGSHSAMASMGAVAGLKVICDCISQPEIKTYVRDMMTDEVAPHLTRPDWAEYREALLQRFANPTLLHSVHQIAMDSSQKIPQRWPPTVALQMRAGKGYEHIAFAAAAWMRYLQGRDEAGSIYALSDPMAGQLQPLAIAHANDPVACVKAISAFESVWGKDLPANKVWQGRVTHWLTQINALGVLKAVASLNQIHAASKP